MDNNKHKAGFAAVIGRPNVGKSTLINAIVGQKIAIVSDKPQTTRDKILAVYNDDEAQIVFTDTPGIHRPKNRLDEFMVNTANETMGDVDVLVFVVAATDKIRGTELGIIENIKKANLPCILVINKIDLVKKAEVLPVISTFSELYPFTSVIPISAKQKDGIDILISDIKDNIGAGPMYYDEDTVTDRTQKQLAAEMIREKMLYLLDKEVPHGIAIEITKFREKNKITEISATIYCEKASHKGIVIGKNGEMLKQIGTLARDEIEKMLDKKVFLELWVKVKADWRNNTAMLRNFGYENK